MRRRGFLQALLGTAAIPAAIKAAEAVESIPDLPVAAPAPEPQPLQVAEREWLYSASVSVDTGACTAVAYVDPILEHLYWRR